MEQFTETIRTDRPLFMVSEPPQQSPEVVDAIDAVNRETLQVLGIPTVIAHNMIPAIRGNTAFFSFQNPDGIVLEVRDGKVFSS